MAVTCFVESVVLTKVDSSWSRWFTLLDEDDEIVLGPGFDNDWQDGAVTAGVEERDGTGAGVVTGVGVGGSMIMTSSVWSLINNTQ